MQNRYTLLFLLLAFATVLSAQNSFYPVAICHSQTNVALGDQCTVTLTPDMVDGGSYTALGTLSLSVSPNQLTLGNYVVTLTASNGIFPVRSCTATVTVEDKTPPELTCRNPVNYTIDDPTLLPGNLDILDVTIGRTGDNCYINEMSVAVRGLTYYGSTAYRATVIDQSGNLSSCQGTVNVRSPHYSGGVCQSYGNTRFEFIQSVGFSSSTNNWAVNSGDNNGQVFFTRENRLRARDALTLTYAPGFNSGNYREYWRFYLDKNRDGDWTDAGETIHEWNGYGGNTATVNLPRVFGRSGISRLRVVMSYGGYKGPCEKGFYGEVEDYAVRLLPLSFSAKPDAGELEGKSGTNEATNEFIVEVPMDERDAPPARFAAEVSPLKDAETVKVFPNPAVAGSSVRIDLGARSQVQQLLLRSMVGSVLAQRPVAKGASTSEFSLPINLKPGIYLLSGNTTDGCAVWSRRLLVR